MVKENLTPREIAVAFSERYCLCEWKCYTKDSESSLGKCSECRKIEVAIFEAMEVKQEAMQSQARHSSQA